MRREPLTRLAMALTATLSSAHAQQLLIKPGIEVRATATTNASDGNQLPRKDLVINVAPELGISYGGARSRIDGRFKVDNLHYSRNSQPDRTLPSGELVFRSDLVDQWGGLEASVETRQVASPLDQSAIPNSYTTTKALIAPFIEHSFDANTKLKAQFEKSIIKSSETTRNPALNQVTDIPDLHASQYLARLERQPVPVGAWLEWTAQDSEAADTLSGPQASLYTYKEKAARAGVSYALNDQLHAGLILGRESIHQQAQTQSDTIRGITLDWHPNERAALNAKVERRFFGTGWKVDWNHRRPLFNWGFSSERTASTYASSVGRVPPNSALNNPANPLDPAFSLAASLRQTLQGRVVFMGQRQSVTLTGGLDKAAPLPLNNAPSIGSSTQERYVEALFNRRLTPLTSLNTSVRWTRSNVDATGAVASPIVAQTGQVRSLLWRGDINTRLSPQATATVGLRHRNASGSQPYAYDESAMYVGLGYRY